MTQMLRAKRANIKSCLDTLLICEVKSQGNLSYLPDRILKCVLQIGFRIIPMNFIHSQ